MKLKKYRHASCVEKEDSRFDVLAFRLPFSGRLNHCVNGKDYLITFTAGDYLFKRFNPLLEDDLDTMTKANFEYYYTELKEVDFEHEGLS